MTKTYEITAFQKRTVGKREFVTKFGGQPDWVRKADWPVSEGWEDRKMTFIGQIFLKKDMLGNDSDLMAYFFMTHPEYYDDDFFDPDIADWEGDWKLLLQLHCSFQPFVLRAGAMPTLFVFISGDFQKGGMLIQDS